MALTLRELILELQVLAQRHGSGLAVYDQDDRELTTVEFNEDEDECVVLGFT